MITLIYQDEKSHKFWSVEQEQHELHIRWGKVGTQGQSRTKTYANDTAATLEKAKLIKEKQKKGYVAESEITTTPKAPHAEKQTLPSSVQSDAKETLSSNRPPWLLETESIPFSPELIALSFSHRVIPHPDLQAYTPMDHDASVALQKLALNQSKWQKENLYVDGSQCSPDDHAHFQLAQQCIDQNSPLPEQSPTTGAILAKVISCYITIGARSQEHPTTEKRYMDALVDEYGLEYVVALIIQYQRFWMVADYRSHQCLFRKEENMPVNQRNYQLREFECRLRFHLSRAEESLWQKCAQQLIEALPSIPLWRQPVIAFLLPEKPELADVIVEQAAGDKQIKSLEWLKLTATRPDTVAVLDHYRTLDIFNNHVWKDLPLVTLLREQGVIALSYIAPYRYVRELGAILSEINHPSALKILFTRTQKNKRLTHYCTTAVARFPHAATAALAEMLSSQKDMPFWHGQLIALLGAHQHIVDDIKPWVSDAAFRVLENIILPQETHTELAKKEDLPAILMDLSWLTSKKEIPIPVLHLPVLPLAPVLKSLPKPSMWMQYRIEEAQKACTADLLEAMGCSSDQEASFTELVDIFEKGDYESFKQRWCTSGIAPYILDVLCALPREQAIAAWNVLSSERHRGANAVMYHLGIDGISGFINSAEQSLQGSFDIAMQLGTTALAPLMANSFTHKKTLSKRAKQWLLDYPEHAIVGLIPEAFGGEGESRTNAQTALLMLAREHQTDLIHDVAMRYERPDVISAIKTLLAVHPIDIAQPVKLKPLPKFYRPSLWRRPHLQSGKALPDDALQHLGTLLSIPSEGGLYPGIKPALAACTSESLAAFGWDLFSAWLAAGAPSKESWAFTALGLLGNDDTARQLTPMIRAWPGESLHARAVAGLDVLAQIGSDTALMQLNGIAKKVKFKALRERANEKIRLIAEQRNLTVDELDDRLAPDLGLDANGSLLLDFGPRQFTVGFDEALKPFVRDAQGSRLKDLPRPNKSDDPELSTESVKRYKALKKDARTIASQQVQRLESAMCQQRRWTHEQFCHFLVEHPLIGHLTRRLVWATYDAEQRLTHCFRVAEDNSYSTADDDEFILPEGTAQIGIPHVLDIPEQDAAAFGQLFTDYELLSPFSQLDRPSYALTPAEQASIKLERWDNRCCPSGRVAGLANKGWLRGAPQDAGWITWMLKPMGDWTAILKLDGGFCVSLPPDEFYDEQSILHVELWKGNAYQYTGWRDIGKGEHTFSEISDVAASELINDVEALFS